jgi:hypothetical protein
VEELTEKTWFWSIFVLCCTHSRFCELGSFSVFQFTLVKIFFLGEFWVVYFCRLRRLPSSPLLAGICWKKRELFKVFFVFLFLPLLLLLVFSLLSPLLSFPTTHLDAICCISKSGILGSGLSLNVVKHRQKDGRVKEKGVGVW